MTDQNMLAHESSPYLRQHKDNPVHWRPWSLAALQEAEASGKPILLSIGYAACHWCHVMAHESFEDEAVAEVMNRLFVNIKVDREERPDIDQIYMAALSAMGEQGGWPLTMFLTPDGRPFWGGTYFPRQARYGRPGFIDVLEAVARTWAEKRRSLTEGADNLKNHVEARLAPAAEPGKLHPALLQDLATSIYGAMDMQRGGLRGAPKFPNAPFLSALWLNWVQSGRDQHRDAVVLTLEKMLAGGIYDHIGGGLCRYSTDDQWLVPHFEKMLYDNAQLIELCCHAYGESGAELFRVRIEETIDWLLREMLVPGGGFASSLDADSEGEEGRFYLWTHDQLVDCLGDDDAAQFLIHHELVAPQGWEGDPILRATTHQAEPAAVGGRTASLKARLLECRAIRVRPGRDDKVLVDWNGLMIAALARAGRLFDKPDWIVAADRAFRFVTESEREGRLPHSILGEDRLFPAMSSDYAAMINAAVALSEASGNQGYTGHAVRWMEALEHWHGGDSGHFLTAEDSSDVPIRVRGDVDEATPSATAQIIEATLRLSQATSDSRLYDRAVNIAEHALGRVVQQHYGQAGIIRAAELVRSPRKLIVVDSKEAGLLTAANRIPDPSRTDVVLTAGEAATAVTLPDGTVIDTSGPGAWLCVGQTCLPPVRTKAELEALLRSPR